MNDQPYSAGHLRALRRFAIIITVVTILGHAFLGFEQSYAQPLVALATAYALQLLLEFLESGVQSRRPRFAGGLRRLVDFLLSAHITALAIAMILYFHERLWVIAFTVAVAIGSKTIFRVPVGTGTRHFLNPSNFGITITLLAMPWVGLAMPWQYTQEVIGIADWLLPGIIFISGGYLNATCTKRMPLIATWLGAFAVQAAARYILFGTSLAAGFAVMSGVTFALFTFYMIPDPATTPDKPARQVAFAAAVAALYGVFMALHIVYGAFLSLTLVCAARGIGLYVWSIASNRRPALAEAARV